MLDDYEREQQADRERLALAADIQNLSAEQRAKAVSFVRTIATQPEPPPTMAHDSPFARAVTTVVKAA